jgi:hypothetical protein
MALTAKKVEQAKAGKHGDGSGLWLSVDANGNRSWFFRYTSPVTRKERFMGLGSAGDVALEAACDAASACRALIRQGLDPIDHRDSEREAA